MRTYIVAPTWPSRPPTSWNWRLAPRWICGSGVEGESEMERAAREDAARDILADNPDLPDP